MSRFCIKKAKPLPRNPDKRTLVRYFNSNMFSRFNKIANGRICTMLRLACIYNLIMRMQKENYFQLLSVQLIIHLFKANFFMKINAAGFYVQMKRVSRR